VRPVTITHPGAADNRVPGGKGRRTGFPWRVPVASNCAGRSAPRRQRRLWPWLLGLWLVALVLALIGLGGQPLRDWDEAIVARVSLEMSRTPWAAGLLPTYLGHSYLNKPPGLHLGIAAAIGSWRWLSGAGPEALPPEWVVRLIPALGSSLLVPLLALVQAKLRPGRPHVAVATGLITLTLLPLARHGRLAMLDGVQLSAMAVVWLGMLMAAPGQRRSLAAGLLAGLGGSMLLLLKAPVALPVLGSALALRALERDRNRLAFIWLLIAMLAGLMPGLLWHGWHLHARGSEALLMWGGQGMARLVVKVNDNGGGPLVPIIQVLSGGWPWLPLLPFGLALAWRERRSRAGLWTLGLSLQAALLVFPLRTQLPWYHLLLWPPFALACGPVLADLASGSILRRRARMLGMLWTALGGLLLIGAGLAFLAPASLAPRELGAILLPAAIGLGAAGITLAREGRGMRRPWAVPSLAAGWLLSLAMLFSSSLWNWELNEQAPIEAALELAGRDNGLSRKAPLTVLAEDAESQRPSLHWYLDSSFRPVERERKTWPRHSFLLLARSDRAIAPALERCRVDQAGSGGWKRWYCR
jgi:4-amino-4-deoxy-L-arabinose transferase-like glycosyltransferase